MHYMNQAYKPLSNCFPPINTTIPGVYLDVSLVELAKMGDMTSWQMIAEYKSRDEDKIAKEIEIHSKSFQLPIYQRTFSISGTMNAYYNGDTTQVVLFEAQKAYAEIEDWVRATEEKFSSGEGFSFNNEHSRKIVQSLKNLLGAV